MGGPILFEWQEENRMMHAALVVFTLVAQGTSIGQTPLTDLGAGTYQGYTGGLYPGGANTRPAAHDAAGLAIAAQVMPVDAAGNPDLVNGRIGLASLGLSNTTLEYQQFMMLAGADPEMSARVLMADGAIGATPAQSWADPLNPCWTTFANRLTNAGMSPAQLQVVWLKLTSPAASYPATFPAGAQQVQAWIRQTVLNLKAAYPSVRIVYFSSRIYAGYATTMLNPEMQAFENGFSVKWLIEAQINGDATLAYGGVNPPAPWMAWGPYLWADGLGADNVAGGVPGRSDGLEWALADFSAADGTHPSAAGSVKVAQMLLDFLKADTVSQQWFLANPPPVPAPVPVPGDSSSGKKKKCGLIGMEFVVAAIIASAVRVARSSR